MNKKVHNNRRGLYRYVNKMLRLSCQQRHHDLIKAHTVNQATCSNAVYMRGY